MWQQGGDILGASWGQVLHEGLGDGAAAALKTLGPAGQQGLAEETAASLLLAQEQQNDKAEGQIQVNSCNSQAAYTSCVQLRHHGFFVMRTGVGVLSKVGDLKPLSSHSWIQGTVLHTSNSAAKPG